MQTSSTAKGVPSSAGHFSPKHACPARLVRPGQRQLVRAAAPSAAPSAQTIKERLFSKVGSKNGLDRTPEQQQEVSSIVSELATTSGDHKLDLTGTYWTLRYTDSTGTSAGKIGPFTGYVEQEFPKDKPGFYYNTVALGLLKARLQAAYNYIADNKIEVNFTEFTFYLGPFKINKDFSGKGYWTLRFTDPSLRVLDSNQDHVFVLEKIPGPKIRV